MENKIICFIDNSILKTKGIFHCFSDNKNILSKAYTNPFCETFLYKADEKIENITPILGQNENKYLFISPAEVKFASSLAEKPEEWKVLLVHDSVPMAEALKVFSPETLILYHKQPEDAEKILKENIGNYKHAIKSAHEPSGKYVLLYEIAEIWKQKENSDWGFEKNEFEAVFKKIVKVLFDAKLEAVLEFLHNCLEKPPKEEDWEKLTDVEIDISKLDKKQTLSEWRDKLLEIALKK